MPLRILVFASVWILIVGIVPVAGAQSHAQVVYLPLVIRDAFERTGEGTYYNADGTGNCSFDPSPEDLMVAAMNHADYDNAALCGAFIEVIGPKGRVVVRIVDRCPECARGDVDMSPQAFARIADLSAGRVPIRWRIVSLALTGPIRSLDSSICVRMVNGRPCRA
jgi:expansin (peptidoglycan-binding protein)